MRSTPQISGYDILRTGEVFKDGKKLTPNRAVTGHLSYWIDGRRVSAGRVVAGAYLGPSDGRVVRYKDGCPWNINVENLEWVSHSKRALAKKVPWWELPERPDPLPDARVRMVYGGGKVYKSIGEAAEKNSAHRGCISRAIRTGIPHKGVVFEIKK